MIGAFITSGITMFIVLVMVTAAFKEHAKLLRLQQVGHSVIGAVVDIDIDRDSDGDATYAPIILYTIYTGETRLHKMGASTGNKKVVGALVPVVYDPAQPDKPVIGPIQPMKVFIWTIIGALFVLGIGTVIVLNMLGIIQSSGSDDAVFLLPLSALSGWFTHKAF